MVKGQKTGITIIVFVFMVLGISAQNNSTKVFSLDGKWELTGYNPDKTKILKLDAVVPGQVHTDLEREGYMPGPFWRDPQGGALSGLIANIVFHFIDKRMNG